MANSVKVYKTGELIIKIDSSKCLGCGTCVTLAPNTFELDKNLKSTVKTKTKDSVKTITNAAQSCPTGGIVVIDKKTGKKL